MSYTCPRCGRTSHHPEDEASRYCGACHRYEGDDRAAAIVRMDRYNITVGGLTVRADPDQERRIHALDREQLAAFARIMGGKP